MSDSDLLFHRAVAGCGLFVMIFLAWCLSQHKRKFPVRVVVGSLMIQLVFVLLILKTSEGSKLFSWLGDSFTGLLDFVDEGCELVFGEEFRDFYFAFKVLPTIVFFSALMAVLYHLRIMQFVVKVLAWGLQRTLKISGAESLSAAANIFVGQTEAPFVIRPYIPTMTKSELTAIMTGGFATVAGGVLALYVGWGIDAGHLITASFISAPAGLLIAKVIYPETENPVTANGANADIPVETSNIIDAATSGASDGLKLALNVAAMLIAFTALIAMCDFLLNWLTLWIGNSVFQMNLKHGISLSLIFGYLFAPLGWLMGIEWKECLQAGELLGLKMIANELIAYDRMREMLPGSGSATELSQRTVTIMTYALSGFSSFASIGIQVGGIGGLCPERRQDLAALGLKAMLGGTLACCMTACVAGVVITDRKVEQPQKQPLTWTELTDADVQKLSSANGTSVVFVSMVDDVASEDIWQALQYSDVLRGVHAESRLYQVQKSSPAGEAVVRQLASEGRELRAPAILVDAPGAKNHPLVQIDGNVPADDLEGILQAALQLCRDDQGDYWYEIKFSDGVLTVLATPFEATPKQMILNPATGDLSDASSR